MTVRAGPGGSSWCDACMGTRRCWVCDGVGSVELRYETADCRSCRTTGHCRYCGQTEPQPTSIVLDRPTDSAAARTTEGSAQG